MSKLFKELKPGDKIYTIELSGTRLKAEKGKPFMKPVIIKSANDKNSFFSGLDKMEIVFEDGSVIYPNNPDSPSFVYVNSRDMSVFNSLNANIYGTSKRTCIEAAINAIQRKNDEQKQTRDRFNQHIDENELTVAILEDELGSADFPDTILEFAEMALT